MIQETLHCGREDVALLYSLCSETDSIVRQKGREREVVEFLLWLQQHLEFLMVQPG